MNKAELVRGNALRTTRRLPDRRVILSLFINTVVNNSHTREWVHDPVLSYRLLALYFPGETEYHFISICHNQKVISPAAFHIQLVEEVWWFALLSVEGRYVLS